MPSSPKHGRKIDHNQVAFIHPGQTTRAQVVDRLGGDYTALPKNRALAYTWELPGGGGVWWYSVFLGEGVLAGGDNWVGGWRGFLVAFDDQNFVTAAAFKKLSCRRPLHGHLNRWVAKLPRNVSRAMARGIADTR